jgi:hypothetical protein
MKPSSGRLSDYEIWTTSANHDGAQSSAGVYIKESFLVGERNLLEICAVAVLGTLFSDSFVFKAIATTVSWSTNFNG